MPCEVGQRVLVTCLQHEEKFLGEILEVGRPINGQPECVVDLDRQDNPLTGVIYLEPDEQVVKCSNWQCCRDEEPKV